LGQGSIFLQSGDQIRISFAPLHLDPGICPAQQSVLTDVACIMVRLMQRFKALENRDECYQYVDKIVFTRESRYGAKVGFVSV
jgi:hypothetical protein